MRCSGDAFPVCVADIAPYLHGLTDLICSSNRKGHMILSHVIPVQIRYRLQVQQKPVYVVDGGKWYVGPGLYGKAPHCACGEQGSNPGVNPACLYNDF